MGTRTGGYPAQWGAHLVGARAGSLADPVAGRSDD